MHVDIQFSPYQLLKTLSFPPLNGFGILVKNNLNRAHVWALFSIPLVSMSVFMPVPHCFDYCNVAVSFEIMKCESFSFIYSSFSRLFWLFRVSRDFI